MKINSFENLMKYISKYKSTPKKISKVKDKFNEYLNLCNEQNIIDYINEFVEYKSDINGTGNHIGG